MKKKIVQKLLIAMLIVCFSASSVSAAALPDNVSSSWVYNSNGTTKTNVRKVAGLSATGYNVLQGSCNDGNGKFYFAFMKKSTGRVIIVEMQYENDKFTFVKKSGALDVQHGNDLTYIPNAGGIDGNNKILITNHEDGYMHHLRVFDVATMKVEDILVCKYWNECDNCDLYVHGKYMDPTIAVEPEPIWDVDDASDDSEEEEEEEPPCIEDYVDEHHGFSNLAYNPETGKLAAALTGVHDLMIFDLKYENGKFHMIPKAYLDQKRDEATIQGLDCDSQHIYSIWSAGGGYSGNRLVVYDWKGIRNKRYTIDCTYEIESISHVGSTFYAGYHHSFIYNWATKEKKKVKWKKVWNKAHTKKVWKYKTKTVKVKHSELRRNGYIKKIKLAS